MRGSSVDLEQPRQAHFHAPTTTNASPVYVVAGAMPAQEPLPCCGIGFGWTLFIVGFLLGAIPWYIGALLLCCVTKKEPREKPGCIACLIAAILGTILIVVWIVANK